MKRRSNVIAVSIFLLATLLVFLVSPRNRQRLQSGFLSLISPFLRKGSELDAAWKKYDSGAKKLGELEAENTKLKTEAERLRAENQALRGVETENLRLQKALGYQTQSPFALLPAKVIGRPGANWWSAIQLDKGTLDGVQPGMCALTADGLVGKVIQTADHMATVLLITDENCKVPARVGDSTEPGKQGIVRADLLMSGARISSTAEPRLLLQFIGRYESLPKGEPVYTSGAGQIYPPGVLIGRVVDAKVREQDKQAVLEPAVTLAGVNDVFIVAGLKGAQAQK